MYYPDLSLYDYGITEYPNALNIGWLEKGQEFPTGDFPEKEQVLKILKSKQRENLYRGWHSCEFCESDRESGNGEYIFHYKEKTYAAPSLIIHYIEVHNYFPPREFIEAVINL
jgi:hypothetical protein